MTCCGLTAFFGWLPTFFDATRKGSTFTVFEDRCNDGTTLCGLAAFFALLPTFLDAACAVGATCIVFEDRFNDGLLNPFTGGKGEELAFLPTGMAMPPFTGVPSAFS